MGLSHNRLQRAVAGNGHHESVAWNGNTSVAGNLARMNQTAVGCENRKGDGAVETAVNDGTPDGTECSEIGRAHV